MERFAERRGPTPGEFDALLSRLGSDRERAGEVYERIRRKLIRLFEWRKCELPEDLADETINRVARRIAEGVELPANDPFPYFQGVAHHLAQESWRRADRQRRAVESRTWPAAVPPAGAEETQDPRADCVRRCLEKLPGPQKALLAHYYLREDCAESRQALCRDLGISMNALRIRVHRVRRKLEALMDDCLRGGGGSGGSSRRGGST